MRAILAFSVLIPSFLLQQLPDSAAIVRQQAFGVSEVPHTAIHSRFIDGNALGSFRWNENYG